MHGKTVLVSAILFSGALLAAPLLSGCSSVESAIGSLADKNIESSIDLSGLPELSDLDVLSGVPQDSEVADASSEALTNPSYTAPAVSQWFKDNGKDISKAKDMTALGWDPVIVDKWGTTKQLVVSGDHKADLKYGTVLLDREFSSGQYNIVTIYEVSGDPLFNAEQNRTEVQVKADYRYTMGTAAVLGKDSSGNSNIASDAANAFSDVVSPDDADSGSSSNKNSGSSSGSSTSTKAQEYSQYGSSKVLGG